MSPVPAYVLPDIGGLTQPKVRPAKAGPIDAFRAPVGTAYDAALSWTYLGRIKAGTYKNDFSRKFYDLMTGVPETIKESFVIGIEAKVDFNLIEPTSIAYETVVGNGTKFPMYGAVPLTSAVAAGTTDNTIVVASTANFTTDMELEITSSGTKYYTYVIGIPDATTLFVYPQLPITPAVADVIKEVQGNEFGMGGSTAAHWAFRFVFTDVNTGSQIITWVNESRADGVKEDFADGKKEMEIPVTLTMFGKSFPGYTGPLVAKKYILTKKMALVYD